MPPLPSTSSPSKGLAGNTSSTSILDSAVVGKRVGLTPAPGQGRSLTPAVPGPGSPSGDSYSGGRGEGTKNHDEEDELEAEVRLLVGAIARRASKGFTGETW